MTSTCIYYVYAYLRSKDSETAKAGTPYYIGKGKGDRIYSRHKRASGKFVPIPPNKENIVIIESNLTNIGALALERRYIRWWGRKDIGTGILINKTDGGDGNSGLLVSEETRSKMSAAKLGKSVSDETRHKMSLAQQNKDYSYIDEEWRNAASERAKGRSASEETKKKISESNLGRKLTNEQATKRNGTGNSFFGKKHTEETKKKIAENNRKRKLKRDTISPT